MSVWPGVRAVAVVAAMTVLFSLGLTAAGVSAAPRDRTPDRTPPTTPTNLRVTATTMTTATLTWDKSTDNSGNFWYSLQLEGTPYAWSTTQTTYTASGLNPGKTYSFRVRAIDGSINSSGWSNAATTTTPPDTQPPTAPGNLTATAVSPSTVTLTWTKSTDNFLWPGYSVFVDGQRTTNLLWTGETTTTVRGLMPGTTYTFTVQAQDSSGNQSPLSNAVTVTTEASTDTTPPTPPANLRIEDQGCGEVRATWDPSTDDVDPASAIRYQIYVNGREDMWTIGVTSTPAYGDHGSSTFTVVAIDRAGNVSAPSNAVTLDIWVC